MAGGKITFPLRNGLWCGDLLAKIGKPTRRWVNGRVKFYLADIPDPSGRQIALAEQSALLEACCRVYFMRFATGQDQGSVNHFLAFEGHLQRNLCALGLSKRRRKAMNLQDYLKGTHEEG